MFFRNFVVGCLILTALIAFSVLISKPLNEEVVQFHEPFTYKEVKNFMIEPTLIKEEIVLTDHNTMNGWNLTWHDEFDQDSINKIKWNTLFDDNGWGDRKQLYSLNNVEVREDHLAINIRKESSNGFEYTSGAVTTQGKFEFLYGKLEIRAKMPKGKGLLPALWLIAASGKSYPEIDFAEFDGNKPNELWNVVHDFQGKKLREFKMTKAEDVSTDFHTYGIEWSEDKLDFFFDGILTFTANKLVPQEAMYIYINTGVGGTWVGNPNAKTVFPNQMLIDYVRYYEK